MSPFYPFYLAEDTDHKDSPPPYESCEPAMEMRDSASSLFELRDVQPTDAFIAVMGMTGSREKHVHSTLLRYSYMTAVVEAHQAPDEIDGRRVIFIDTPGFDDTIRSDSAILREIANWLNKAHERTARNNLRLFKKLCGEDSMSSVALATTHWGSGAADRERQHARYEELREDEEFWKPMIHRGATPFIHDEERLSALKIVRHLLDNPPLDGIDLTIQKEMADGITLDKTAAGIVLEEKLEDRKELYESDINDLRREIAEVRRDIRLNHKDRETEKLEKDYELLRVNRDQLQLERSKELEDEARRQDEMEAKLQAEKDQNEHLRDENKKTKKQLKQIKARIRQAQGCALM
ncbi:hypothetical protein AYO20_06052 [Fonsecaea nubica]|uniref:G domain-containing protein n=1 Tax=Fonsecaea nubica TaxID=856822 RepID=A0A178D0G3_9EURO|nr:hypothetical protein AYO20_06052 [Fonsecaea nubica]OAL34635.1 hypothetical protein AYO20_06052 [Fonsecaea nubica]